MWIFSFGAPPRWLSNFDKLLASGRHRDEGRFGAGEARGEGGEEGELLGGGPGVAEVCWWVVVPVGWRMAGGWRRWVEGGKGVYGCVRGGECWAGGCLGGGCAGCAAGTGGVLHFGGLGRWSEVRLRSSIDREAAGRSETIKKIT